jgi:hypothetical protein
MKRFLIAAFIVVDAKDEDTAVHLAGALQFDANQPYYNDEATSVLFLDEEKKTIEIPIDNDNDLPHTFPL